MRTYGLFNRLKENEHAEWLLNRVMEQIILGKLKHNDLIFDEKSEWHYSMSVPTFLYEIQNIGGTSVKFELYHRINLAGHIQLNNLGHFSIKQNAPYFYSVEAFLYKGIDLTKLVKNIIVLLRMVYTGMKERRTIQMPKKTGIYLLVSEDFKVEIKETIRKHLDFIIDNNHFLSKSYKIDKEELDWLTLNSELFLYKLDIKLIYWEDLIELIESRKVRKDINDFYKLCKRHKTLKRYKL